VHTLGEAILRNADCHPSDDAFVCQDRRLDWKAYVERCLRLGSALHRAGLGRRDRAAILAPNCLEYYELYGANALSGVITASINFRLAAPEVDYILTDASARALFFDAQYALVVAELRETHPEIGKRPAITVS